MLHIVRLNNKTYIYFQRNWIQTWICGCAEKRTREECWDYMRFFSNDILVSLSDSKYAPGIRIWDYRKPRGVQIQL